MIMQHTN